MMYSGNDTQGNYSTWTDDFTNHIVTATSSPSSAVTGVLLEQGNLSGIGDPWRGNLAATPPQWSPDPASGQYYSVSGLLLVCCAILGATGNGLIVIVLGRKGIPQNVTPTLIANLAVAHFLISILCVPVEAAFFLNGGNWVLGDPLCKIIQYLSYVLASDGILTLSAIAIDRYYSVVYPLDRKLCLWKGHLMVLYCWFHAAVISLPKLFVCKVYTLGSGDIQTCDEQWSSVVQAQAYLVSYTVLTIFVPLLITCMAYVLVWKAFRVSQRKVNVMQVLRRPRNASYVPYASKTEIRLLKMLLLMVFCFVILWAPHVVYLFIRHFNPTQILSEYFILTSFWIRKIQPVIDPIIYGYLNKHFRQNLRELVHACSVRCADDIIIDEFISSDNFPLPSSPERNQQQHIPEPHSPIVVEPPKPADPSIKMPLQRCFQSNAYSFTFTADSVKTVETIYPQDRVFFSTAKSRNLVPSSSNDLQNTVPFDVQETTGNGKGNLHENKGKRKRHQYLRKRRKKVKEKTDVPSIEIGDIREGDLFLRVNIPEAAKLSPIYGSSEPDVLIENPIPAMPRDSAFQRSGFNNPSMPLPRIGATFPPQAQPSFHLPSMSMGTSQVNSKGLIYTVDRDRKEYEQQIGLSSSGSTVQHQRRRRKPILSKRMKNKQIKNETSFSDIGGQMI